MGRSSLHNNPRSDQEGRNRGIGGSPPAQTGGHRSSSTRSPRMQPDCALGDNDAFKLYIGHVHGHIPAKMLFSVFRKLGLGRLLQGDDAVQLISRKARKEGQRDYNSAIISFQHPFLRGRDASANADMINHIVSRNADGTLAADRTRTFSLVYQDARVNQRTGKDEPERHWDVRFWTENAHAGSTARPSRPRVTLVEKAQAGRRANAPAGLRPVPTHPGPIPGLGANSFAALAPQSPDYSPHTPPAPTTASPPGLAALEAEEKRLLLLPNTAEWRLLSADPDQDAAIAAIDAERDAELERPGIHAEGQAAGDELTAEYAVAATGAGNIHGSEPQPEDLLRVGIAHPYGGRLGR